MPGPLVTPGVVACGLSARMDTLHIARHGASSVYPTTTVTLAATALLALGACVIPDALVNNRGASGYFPPECVPGLVGNLV